MSKFTAQELADFYQKVAEGGVMECADHDRKEFVQRALNALGLAYRHDWSDFDGRHLLYQLSDISRYLDDDRQIPEFSEWLKESFILEVASGKYHWHDA